MCACLVNGAAHEEATGLRVATKRLHHLKDNESGDTSCWITRGIWSAFQYTSKPERWLIYMSIRANWAPGGSKAPFFYRKSDTINTQMYAKANSAVAVTEQRSLIKDFPPKYSPQRAAAVLCEQQEVKVRQTSSMISEHVAALWGVLKVAQNCEMWRGNSS